MNTPPAPMAPTAWSSHEVDTPAIAAVGAAFTVSAPPEVVVHSRELFKGQRTIAIAHNGAVYRLQSTRQGKLILTK